MPNTPISKHSISSRQFRLLELFNSRKSDLKELKVHDLAQRAEILRERARKGEDLESLLVESFSLVGEAAYRAAGLEPYDVQILAGPRQRLTTSPR